MKNDYNKEKLLKALETKLNEQKMLTETLYEAFEKGSSEATLANIEDAIKDTVRSVMEIKKEIEEIDSLNVEYKRYSDKPSNIFDSIKKEGKEDVAPKTRLEMAKEKCASANRESKYDWKHTYLDEIRKNDDATFSRIIEMDPPYKNDVPEKIQYNDIGELLNVDHILFCNRFLLDLKTIGIPETMVKWVHSDVFNGDNIIEAQIYDFVNEDGEPVLSILSKYIGTKFTAEIKHLNPIGTVIYKEKYNGCKIEKIIRDSLRYDESEPSGILLRIHYDGVSYEAGC
jgi:hypothetical protein